MTTYLFTHPSGFDHDTGPDHPERAARLRAVVRALEQPAFHLLTRLEAPAATRQQLERVHDTAYVAQILSAAPAVGYHNLDPDTVISPGSVIAAQHAAGAVCAAVDAVMDDGARNAFCALRPPGHHAERAAAMGFCLFNNIAIGAAHARHAHGLARVAAIDFDVHHGNGTQAFLQTDAGYFYGSSHQHPAFPGTGLATETGDFANVVNVELAPGSGSDDFRRAWQEDILPALDAFAPEILLVSAGFDAHARDPLAYLRLDAGDFEWVSAALVDLVNRHCQGRLVSTLEGGYDLPSLSESVAAHVSVLMSS